MLQCVSGIQGQYHISFWFGSRWGIYVFVVEVIKNLYECSQCIRYMDVMTMSCVSCQALSEHLTCHWTGMGSDQNSDA